MTKFVLMTSNAPNIKLNLKSLKNQTKGFTINFSNKIISDKKVLNYFLTM